MRPYASGARDHCGRSSSYASTTGRLRDNARVRAPVERDVEGLFEAQMRHELGFRNGRLSGEPRPVDEPFADVGVDGEVADVAGGEVLEEMAALRRRDAEIGEPGLDDRARARNLIPSHRNAEQRVGRSPPADADEQVTTSRRQQIGVALRDYVRDLVRARAIEPVHVDDHHVAYVGNRAVAEHVA